jgi:hypothetical protein
MTDAAGVPVGLAAAGAHRHDSKLLEPTIEATKQQLGDTLPEHPTLHLDSAYNGKACAAVLQAHNLAAVIAAKGVKAPIQAGKRWPVERTNSWMNDFGEVRRSLQRTRAKAEFFLYLAAAFGLSVAGLLCPHAGGPALPRPAPLGPQAREPTARHRHRSGTPARSPPRAVGSPAHGRRGRLRETTPRPGTRRGTSRCFRGPGALMWYGHT